MAELEAVFEDKVTKSRKGWRHPLPDNTPVKLGRLPTDADWWMPDGLISSWHATVTWDGERLLVEERPDPRPVNRIYHKRQPVSKVALAPGESFVIGNTVFTVHGSSASFPPESADHHPAAAGTAPAEVSYSRDQLRNQQHRDPQYLLNALERLPDALRLATNEEVLFRQMVQTILDALPLASAAAVVAADPAGGDAGGPVRVRYNQQKMAIPAGGAEAGFAPSRKLVRRAVAEQKQSVVYVWDANRSLSVGGDSGMTIGGHVPFQAGTPWAICTPLQDDSGLALYVDGVLPRPPGIRNGRLDDDELRDYLKLVELIASLIEATMKAHGMERRLTILRQFLPKGLRQTADPRKLEEILRPRVVPVTVLFCDIRGSVRIAESGKADLEQTWQKLSAALDDMTQVITMNGGMVAGFQGDAVMAFWGWPSDPGDQILKAAQTALRIRERFDTQGQYKDFSCGLGLAHGPAVAGKLGAHDLAKVDVFGPTVNLASRLESLTKRFGARILMDESVAAGMRAAGMDRQVGRIRQLGRFRPVGMEDVREGVMISELMAKEGEIGGEMWEAVRRRWEEAVKFFLAGDWPRALRRFRDQFRDDKVGQELIAFIEEHGPLPPGDWEVYPVVPLKSK